MIYQGRKSQVPLEEVCIHTSATPGNWHIGMSIQDMVTEIRRWHVQHNGWRDIGYHRVFAPNGDIGVGRSLYDIGAGVRGRNRGVAHLCLVPVNDHNGIARFEDYFTEDQKEGLVTYIEDLKELTDIKRITGHNQFAAKECPGFLVEDTDWLQALVS